MWVFDFYRTPCPPQPAANDLTQLTDQEQTDLRWMQLALNQAREAALAGEVPVGAIVVRDGAQVSAAFNAPISLHDPTAHAEVLALRQAALQLANYRLDGCDLYVTLEPCSMCVGAILQARIRRVVFGAFDAKIGAAGSICNLFEQTALNHQTQVASGVLAEDCAAELRHFFQQQRAKAKQMKAQPGRALREDVLRTPQSCFSELPAAPIASCYIADLPSLAGMRMHYLDSGPDSAALAILFLHDWESWSQCWHEILRQKPRQERRLLCPDLIGFGQSDKPKRTSVHALNWHARILQELLSRLQITEVTLIAPENMRPLVDLLIQLACTVKISCQWVLPPVMTRQAALAPFPDDGHRAGPRAFQG